MSTWEIFIPHISLYSSKMGSRHVGEMQRKLHLSLFDMVAGLTWCPEKRSRIFKDLSRTRFLWYPWSEQTSNLTEEWLCFFVFSFSQHKLQKQLPLNELSPQNSKPYRWLNESPSPPTQTTFKIQDSVWSWEEGLVGRGFGPHLSSSF